TFKLVACGDCSWNRSPLLRVSASSSCSLVSRNTKGGSPRGDRPPCPACVFYRPTGPTSPHHNILKRGLDPRIFRARELAHGVSADVDVLFALHDREQLVDRRLVAAPQVDADQRVLHVRIGGRVVDVNQICDRRTGAAGSFDGSAARLNWRVTVLRERE